MGPLAANSQTLDDLLVTPLVLVLDVVEQTPAQAHHLEKAAPRVIVVFVQLEMLCEPIDALGEECDLHLRRARITLLGCVFSDNLLLAICAERHRGPFQLDGKMESGSGRDVVQPGRAKARRDSPWRSGEVAALYTNSRRLRGGNWQGHTSH